MLALVAAPLCLALSSCCDHEATVSIKGDVAISKTEVKNGDEVILSIGKIPQSSPIISITISNNNRSCDKCGKVFFYDPTPMVHYYIDDKEVGISEEADHYFACSYTVSGLSAGEHTLSAKAVPLHENEDIEIKYEGGYTSTTFKVIAE